MSKNITIQEGGVARLLTAERLKTALAEGGSCYWVPEDETRLTRKTITKNGRYRASDEGFYGYSEINVNVSGGAGALVGKDENGNDVAVNVDGDGKIVRQTLPSEIRVTALPDVVTYGDGAYIDFTGLTVTCYDARGNSMGDLPAEELILPVTVARYDPEAAEVSSAVNVEFNLGPYENPIRFTTGAAYGMSRSTVEYELSRVCRIAAFQKWTDERNSYYSIIAASPEPFTAYRLATGETHSAGQYKYDGRTVYYIGSYGSSSDNTPVPPAQNGIPGYNGGGDSALRTPMGGIAWAMCYGDATASGGVQIPVRWARAGDGQLLETSFPVTVIPAGGHGED